MRRIIAGSARWIFPRIRWTGERGDSASGSDDTTGVLDSAVTLAFVLIIGMRYKRPENINPVMAETNRKRNLPQVYEDTLTVPKQIQEELLIDLRHLITDTRSAVAVTINAGQTLLYWRIGEADPPGNPRQGTCRVWRTDCARTECTIKIRIWRRVWQTQPLARLSSSASGSNSTTRILIPSNSTGLENRQPKRLATQYVANY